MSESFIGVWPDGSPTTLWNYDLLRPSAERPFPLPFMGIRPDWDFLLAYGFGIAVILIFSWRRFNQPSFDPASADFVVLKELAPAQLRGPGPVRQAYFYYAGVLVVLYSVLTFFGGIVFSVWNAVQVAGLQVDIGSDTLKDKSWPLTLALALAGFTPLLKPLELAETWLRQRAHHWVGIPVRIKAHTRRLLDALDKTIDQEEVHRREKKIPGWAIARIRNGLGDSRLVQKRLELEIMVKAIRNSDSWPDVSILDEVRPLAKRVTQEADVALLQLDDVLKADFNEPGALPADHAAQNGATDPSDSKRHDQLARHQRQLEMSLVSAADKLNRSRLDTGAIIAVYAERSEKDDGSARKLEGIDDVSIRTAIEKAFPDVGRLDTAFWIAPAAFLTFFLYAAAAWVKLHGLLSTVKPSAVTVFATAGLETLRVVMLLWVPLLVVLAWRQYLVESDKWFSFSTKNFSRRMVVRSIAVAAVAGLVAILGLALVAIAWIAIVADNPDRFRTLLVSSKVPALFFHSSAVFCSMAFVVICSWAADLLAESHSRRKAFALGLLCAMFVSIFMAGHVLFWDAIGCQDLTCIVTRSKEGFSRAFANGWLALYVKYNLTDFIVYFVSAFFAASIFVGPVRSARIQQDAAIDPGAEVEGVGKGVKKNSPSLATAVCFAFLGPLLLLINPSRVEADPVAAARKAQFGRTVVVGFRSDAEPFSYRAGTGGTKTYRGFIVDLCHDVFEGSIYSVEQVEISAADRYENLRRGKFLLNDLSKLDRSRIDILCEPTTLRFDREVERANGIFSPIIFVSGVSYLMRPTRELNPQTYLAYVAGTTAANVARLACKNDLFSLRDEDGTTLEDCVAENWRSYDPLTGSSKAVAGCPAVASPGIQRGGQQYRICAFSSHDKLIEWFCQGPTAPLQSRLVYFGDREIIRAKLESWKARERCPTQGIEEQQAYYTYEPYALLMSRADPCLVQFVQRRIYEFFSHRSKANSLFATYFPDAQMSPVVASLFLLNAVDEERRFRVPDLGEDPPDAVKLEAALDERVSGAECYRKVDP